MNNYVTAAAIKQLRENKKMTQAQLAEKLCISSKAVSRWETGKGFPDISLIEPLAAALGISVIELISGDLVINKNRSSNMKRGKFYVCPICGNVIFSTGEALISCCGITLPCLEADEEDSEHTLAIEHIDGGIYLSAAHPMTKKHYISFIAYVTSDKAEIKKLYPEAEAAAGFMPRGSGDIYWYCNCHGLFKKS